MTTPLTAQERVDHYHKITKYPQSLYVGEDDGRIVGVWIMGNSYKVQSQYHGGYPAGYLKRVQALFPDKEKVLHLFSGKVDTTIMPGTTVDLNPELGPDIVDDAQELTNVPLHDFDLVLCDPPYTQEDAEKYGTTLVKRNKVMDALGRGLKKGTHVVWLDQAFPMFRKTDFRLAGVIGMVKSTNHRFRVVLIFEKL